MSVTIAWSVVSPFMRPVAWTLPYNGSVFEHLIEPQRRSPSMSRATSRCLLSVVLLATSSGVALAERDQLVENWVAPTSWSRGSSSQASEKREASGNFSHPVPFIALTPCRLADTRGNGFGGAFGPPSLVPAMARSFPA